MSEHWALPEVVNEGTPDEYVMSGSHRLDHITGGDCHVLNCCMCESCYEDATHQAEVVKAEVIVTLLNLPSPVEGQDYPLFFKDAWGNVVAFGPQQFSPF